ncbi:MAG: hypothetical protein FWC22_07795 [Treponema sp.]|nr:hypothetical protein [Treponema sp.]
MKKLIIVLIFMALIAPVFAQSKAQPGLDLYYLNVPVEKIYPTKNGYIVLYRSSSLTKTVGIPNEWFSNAGGKAELMRLPVTSDWPTMSVFYVEGEFSHVRLYVHRAKSHLTWGSIPQGTDVDKYFEDKENFNIQF